MHAAGTFRRTDAARAFARPDQTRPDLCQRGTSSLINQPERSMHRIVTVMVKVTSPLCAVLVPVA
jgi:hypothetical protein